ncbi:MAG: replication initiation protein, partial [Allobaculum sp.]|nr:replication initiation protein [Allobaculum sp.]
MPSHKKDGEMFAPAPEFKYVGGFENALAVINNLVARAKTQWNLEESKLFILAVSQIETRDEECWVKLRKKDVINTLEIDPRKTNELRQKLINVKDKSRVEFYGPGANDWEVGNLIRRVKTDRYYVSVQFDEYYLPLLHYVKDTLFTQFGIKNVMRFHHKS